MFHSAVMKLTAWYLLILMSTSLLFSLALYNISTSEVQDRLDELQSHFESGNLDINPYNEPNHRLFSAFRNDQRTQADHNILTSLIYVNLSVLVVGGVLSYALARRTLRHIEESHDLQNRFTSDASHELRTPLAVMKSELEVALKDPTLTKSEMREILESNLEEVNRLTKLSQTLLHMSRLDYSGLEFQAIDIGSVISDVDQRYDKNLDCIKLSLPKAQLFVKANPASIEELFTILIDNALKYSPQKSEINASLRAEGKQAVFIISNLGEGIPADKLPYIFDRFYRADNSRSDKGAGLGLALAKEIVAIHHGELSVSSARNKKTTFIVRLPVSRKNQA